MTLNSIFVLRATTLAVAALATWGAQAQSAAIKADFKKGQTLASGVCAGCHAADGNSTINTNPKLAGQHAEYLVKQLTDFAKKPDDKSVRTSAVMAGFAATLSPEDRTHVAAWFAAQKPISNTAKNKASLDLGAQVYRAGLPDKAVPACAGCHSPNGAGIPAQYPRLAGQFAEYTEAQLKAFRDGARHNNVAMQQIAARLSDKEIAAVADYIAGLR